MRNTITTSTSRVGTYYQLSAGLAAQVLNTGWVGFVRGDYRFGDNIEGWTGNAGVRYNFISGTAAPMGKMVVKGPRIPAPLYNWSGFYIGGHFGVAQGRGADRVRRHRATRSIPGSAAISPAARRVSTSNTVRS